MNTFPRTKVGPISVSRMIIGTNWFLGYSHTSKAASKMITSMMTPQKIADILEVFLAAGVDTVMCPINPMMKDGLEEARQRTGKNLIVITTPSFKPLPDGHDENNKILDAAAAMGSSICMPHTGITDRLVNRLTRNIPGMDAILSMIRQREMATGLSTHMPEAPIYADETDLDVDTYIQIYNAIGFLMQIEVSWVYRAIWESKKPVMTIKPMAAGRLEPLVGLGFAWGTLRPQDMVTVGTFSPDEAKEVIEISLAVLDNRKCEVALETTRSKMHMERLKQQQKQQN